MAMWIRQYNAKCITHDGRLRATLDAIGRCHWASMCPVLPRRMPWSLILAQIIELWRCEIAVPKLAFATIMRFRSVLLNLPAASSSVSIIPHLLVGEFSGWWVLWFVFFISDHQSVICCHYAEAAVSLWLLQYPFVIKLDKTWKRWRSMKVADILFHSLIREQNPFVDLSNKGGDSSNQGTHKSIKYLE